MWQLPARGGLGASIRAAVPRQRRPHYPAQRAAASLAARRPALRAPWTSAPPRWARGLVEVSPDRLEEFLKAEIVYLGQGHSTISLETIVEHSKPETVAKLIHQELPQRFATRIRQIEELTPDWQEIPNLRAAHDVLMHSFRNLRLVDLDASNLDVFTELIREIRSRHRTVVPLYAKAAGALKQSASGGAVGDAAIDAWLDTIMRSRVGTEMITAHYIRLLTDPDENHVGILDTKCDPARICNEAIQHVKSRFADAGVNIGLRVEQPDIEFSFISKYLFLIVEELLMNSVCATLARSARRGESPKDINVLVCEDPRRIGIKISDEGGGVPVEHTEKIWEYSFSTTPADLEEHQTEASPLSGSGMGLPLCRIYTQYLGGSLHLMSMPGVGTDVYMFLNRIDAGHAAE